MLGLATASFLRWFGRNLRTPDAANEVVVVAVEAVRGRYRRKTLVVRNWRLSWGRKTGGSRPASFYFRELPGENMRGLTLSWKR